MRVQFLVKVTIAEQDASEDKWDFFVTLLGLCPRPRFHALLECSVKIQNCIQLFIYKDLLLIARLVFIFSLD